MASQPDLSRRLTEHAVVSPREAAEVPYPYVHVNDDGTVRDLHAKEREYLETPFNPMDGARPYVKMTYDQRNGWGTIGGYCARSAIPAGIELQPCPTENPARALTKQEFIDFNRKLGLIVEEQPDGSVLMRKPQRRPWWKFWARC